METDWNGLLWNDYMNCDSCGAQDLWAAEREKLEAIQIESASSTVSRAHEKSATTQQPDMIEREHKHDSPAQNTSKQQTEGEPVCDEVYEDAQDHLRSKPVISTGSAED